jgi:hypothetical protein
MRTGRSWTWVARGRKREAAVAAKNNSTQRRRRWSVVSGRRRHVGREWQNKLDYCRRRQGDCGAGCWLSLLTLFYVWSLPIVGSRFPCTLPELGRSLFDGHCKKEEAKPGSVRRPLEGLITHWYSLWLHRLGLVRGCGGRGDETVKVDVGQRDRLPQRRVEDFFRKHLRWLHV